MLYYVGTIIFCCTLGFFIGQYLATAKNKKANLSKSKWSNLLDTYAASIESVYTPSKASLHMADARKISVEIQYLCGRVETPSMSALHSKYKNDIKRQITELNRERLIQLQLAVKNGYDPTLRYDGNKMKLSAIVALESSKLSVDKSIAVSSKPQIKPKSHLTIIK